MKNFLAIGDVIVKTIISLLVGTALFVAGVFYGGMWATVECSKMVVEDAHAITSKGRVITDVRVVPVGRDDFRVEFTHRPRPFYFPDDAGKVTAKP